MLLPTIAAVARAGRRRRWQTVLGYLHLAMATGMPLDTLLRAAANGSSLRSRRELERLSNSISDGHLIGEAMRRSLPSFPRRMVRMLNVGASTGKLPEVVDRLINETQLSEGNTRRGYHLAYFLSVILFVSVIVGVLMIFVIPKFEQILKDYDAKIPFATRLLMQAGEASLYLMPLLAAALIVFLGTTLGAILQAPLTGVSASWFERLSDRITWSLPILRSLARDKRMADVCRSLSDSFASGATASRAIHDAGALELGPVLKKRIEHWRMGIERGEELGAAARAARVPEPAPAFLGAASRTESISEAMSFLSRYYAARFSRTMEMLAAAAVPMMTILLGAIVLIVALGLFQPMLLLVESSTINTGLH